MPLPGAERIAIVGIGGLFPGAPDLEAFWNNIARGIDAGRPVPAERWSLPPERACHSDGVHPDRVYSDWGCFLDPFRTDPAGLNLDPKLLDRLDPLLHLGLETARRALTNGHVLQIVDRRRVGVILGNIALPTESTSGWCRDVLGRTFVERLRRDAIGATGHPEFWNSVFSDAPFRTDWHPWNCKAASLPASLIAHSFELGGVAYTLDAACASSLYALKFACEELRAYRADAMLTGGMSRPDCQYTQMGFAQLQALSRRGCCAPLSAAADGLVVGEGAGMFVLKRLSDAVAAGDQIYGVIAGIGLSNDRGANLLAPHSEGQLRAMSAAYADAGWRPSDVDLIECHATGTPVGDQVEISSLHALWKDEPWRSRQCVIGGVKSNVGHLLTGAGAAGLMKVLLALRHQQLPPTANYRQPAPALDTEQTPFRVLAASEPWPARTNANGALLPRRATVNAFGFGGINAHVLIEEFPQDGSQSSTLLAKPASISVHEPRTKAGTEELAIAIIGMARHIGSNSLEQQADVTPNGVPNNSSPAADWGVRSSDWYRTEFGDQNQLLSNTDPITEICLPVGQYRIPPVEMQDMLPQQQLMLAVAAAALRNADAARSQRDLNQARVSMPSQTSLGDRTGVYIGIELDPNTSNFHLRWTVEQVATQWASELGLTDDAEIHEWIEQLKASITPPLSANRVMGNLGGIVASRLAREFDVGGPSFTVSADENSGLRACELAVGAIRRGELDRAIVGAVDFPCEIRNHVAALRQAARPVGTTSDGAVALILKRWEDAVRDGDTIHAIIRGFQASEASTGCQQVQSHVSVGAATGLVSLVEAVESLRDRRCDSELPQYWLQNRADGLRKLMVAGHGLDGRTMSIELAEHVAPSEQLLTGPSKRAHVRLLPNKLPANLFVIRGATFEALTTELRRLQSLAADATSIESFAQQWFQQTSLSSSGRTMVLIVRNLAELPDVVRSGLQRLERNGAVTTRDRRVAFSSEPLAAAGKLAYVFPGSGNAFAGMGRELLLAFPAVLDQQQTENECLRDQFRPDLIWNGESTAQLLDDHKAMIFTQVAIGTAVCDLLSLFGVRPAASLGYSLGESAALFGLRAWMDRDEMLRRMHDSGLFGSDLVRPFDAARKAWSVPDGTEVDWISGLVDRSAATIKAALARQPQEVTPFTQVYLLIVNTPTQCVIGGLRSQVAELVQQLGAQFVPFAAPSTVHCKILREVEPAYHALHWMRTAASSISFYSTAHGRSYELNQQSAAESIVAQAVDTIDFTRVVEQSYADGVRMFLEIGPGNSCTRMIDEILKGRPRAAWSALPATSEPVLAFLELLAQLLAEGIAVDLRRLFPDESATPDYNRRNHVVTRNGGRPFEPVGPPNGWPSPESLQAAIQFVKLPARNDPIVPPPIEAEPLLPMENSSSAMAPLNEPLFDETPAMTSASELVTQWTEMVSARLKAHEQFLGLSTTTQRLIVEQLEMLERPRVADDSPRVAINEVPTHGAANELPAHQDRYANRVAIEPPRAPLAQATVINDAVGATPQPIEPPRALNRQQCLQFAIGKIGDVLGRKFAAIDQHPTRVRLPDEPLMLVDRILDIEGEPLSMTSGRVVTEHDIHDDSWYLDCDRIPTCIAVEAGQADLFLSGWLGIDEQTKGHACYRLLDAVVTFHAGLPGPGQVIHYDIRINHFFRQGQTYLFRFEFDATVDGKPLLTMREGCAGFFTEAELSGGKGIVQTTLDRQPRVGKRPADWKDLVPLSADRFNDAQLRALRQGDLAGCFGQQFAGLPLQQPVTLPGLSATSDRSRMWLVDRILQLEPAGGRFGLGLILGELDIHPNDWFLTCHFCDDQVMPGTLMYECCMHTLRVHLLRMGWIGERGKIAYEPVAGVRSRLKCRGQVLSTTKKVWYEITLKEIGYDNNGTPFCLADALMSADGKPIVEITDMSVQLAGLTRTALERMWALRAVESDSSSDTAPSQQATTAITPAYDRRPAIFDTDRITAFAIGKPSAAFGDRYRIFDEERTIARLPGPPFQFLDRIVSIQGCEPWVLKAGGEVVAQYDIPPDAWYFAANRQRRMPFSVLLETALQPCGWLAAYVGSALTSDIDISFRNLGGTAVQSEDVTPNSGTLTTRVKMTAVSNSGGMIIQHYEFDLRCQDRPVYTGTTYFGFFSKASLANQIGIRDAKPFQPTADARAQGIANPISDRPPFPDRQFQMVDDVLISTTGGPAGEGFAFGTMTVKPDSWFFKAHFYQDPVVPGSLGLESFFQILKCYAARRWNVPVDGQFITPLVHPRDRGIAAKHEWVYRGQVVPRDRLVTVSAVIATVNDATRELTADGYLSVDGRVIYQMKGFSLGVE